MMFSLYKGLMNEHGRNMQKDKETDMAKYDARLRNIVEKRKQKEKS
jgi:hypothetical protein